MREKKEFYKKIDMRRSVIFKDMLIECGGELPDYLKEGDKEG